MVVYSNSYSDGPDHSKPKQLEIGTKWQPFFQISNGFGQNGSHFVQNGVPLENQIEGYLRIPNAFGISAPTCNVVIDFSYF